MWCRVSHSPSSHSDGRGHSVNNAMRNGKNRTPPPPPPSMVRHCVIYGTQSVLGIVLIIHTIGYTQRDAQTRPGLL